MVWPVAPPVVIEMTASHSSLMPEQYSLKTPGSEMGRPSSGSRAWRWMTAAPSRAASTDWLMWSSTVTGMSLFMVGVWEEPVTAHVTITPAIQALLRLPHPEPGG